MIGVLIVDKTGTVSESIIKKYDETMLYKKVGLKTAENFEIQHTYSITYNHIAYSISIYGKTVGKSSCVNKYEFPPPIDNILFYGNCLLVGKVESSNTHFDLKISEWNLIYPMLYGGFEDIDESSEEESDIESVDIKLLTKDGYMKDDFVVDDSEIESFESDDNVSEISDIKLNNKKGSKKITKKCENIVTKNVPRRVVKKIPKIVESVDNTYLGCACELVADEYFK
jgi:hypothetical protein